MTEHRPPLHVHTIGHSTQTYDQFVQRLRQHGISAIADVRSAPFSRNFPHFNRDELRTALRGDSIAYVFLGRELGGRPSSDSSYLAGIADYEAMARLPEFHAGIDRVIEGAQKYKIALMCSEHDPLDCHRCLLVGRALKAKSVAVCHITGTGGTITHEEIESRLLSITKKDGVDLFAPPGELLSAAYRERSMRVAYASPEGEQTRQKFARRSRIG